MIPIYDTAPNDFNFASIYTENSFGAMTASRTTTC